MLADGNIAYYEKALKFAYTHLEDFEQDKGMLFYNFLSDLFVYILSMLIHLPVLLTNTFWYTDKNDGSECHKLIMVFSDGGTENPTKILNVYTNSSREITSDARIFTYAVGNFIISEIFYSINLQN